MIDNICFYFILYIVYSFVGWSIEVIGKLFEKHKFINRGFLIGPICPIYGWGCLAIILLLSRYKSNPILLFIMAIIICSFLEYFTSYFMEKIFHARWWDYTRRKYNINGRICAETMIPFGILGCTVIYIINPIFVSVISKFSTNAIHVIAIILGILFIIDNIISLSIMFGFRDTLKTLEKDGTEEITKKVREILHKKNYLYKRLLEAFPNFSSRKERIILLQKHIKENLQTINKKNK